MTTTTLAGQILTEGGFVSGRLRCTAAIASATFSGPSPPARTMRPSAADARSQWPGSGSPHGRSRSLATGWPLR